MKRHPSRPITTPCRSIQSLLNAYFWLLGSISMIGAFGPTARSLVRLCVVAAAWCALCGARGGGSRQVACLLARDVWAARVCVHFTLTLPFDSTTLQFKSQPLWRFELPGWMQASPGAAQRAQQG